MKTFIFILLQTLFCLTAFSQWVYEATLPNDSTRVPFIYQLCVIDSSVSWAFGQVYISSIENRHYPYIAKRTVNSWRHINTDLNLSTYGYCITATDSLNIWLGTNHPSEIYYSSNGGVNWILQIQIADTGHVKGIEFCKQNPQIGYAFGTLAFNTFYNGAFILKTTNRGMNWARWDFVDYGFKAEDFSIAVTDSNHVWCGVNQVPSGIDKIIMTTTGGVNWIITEIEASLVGPQNIRFSEDNQTGVFVGFNEPPSSSSFFRTTNGGYNWSVVYTPADAHYSRAMRWVLGTSNIYECSEFVVVCSTNSGVNWTIMTGTPSSGTSSLDAVRINEGTIYAIMENDRRIYKLLDTARIIGIENTGNSIPKQFSLSQNYPNPFNPITKINYEIPKTLKVNLVIYDILGREVKKLVNEVKEPGRYTVEFDGTNYASGVYFYRIEAGTFIVTKKMVLVK